jgi:site-specific recombinase XerD
MALRSGARAANAACTTYIGPTLLLTRRCERLASRASWLTARAELPVGPLFCIIDGPTRGRPWSGAAVRSELRRLAAQAGIRRRFAPHQLRHAHALELAREGVPLNIIQRQLGHANLGTGSIYLQGIDPEEIIATVRARRAPMMSASAGLEL